MSGKFGIPDDARRGTPAHEPKYLESRALMSKIFGVPDDARRGTHGHEPKYLESRVLVSGIFGVPGDVVFSSSLREMDAAGEAREASPRIVTAEGSEFLFPCFRCWEATKGLSSANRKRNGVAHRGFSPRILHASRVSWTDLFSAPVPPAKLGGERVGLGDADAVPR